MTTTLASTCAATTKHGARRANTLLLDVGEHKSVALIIVNRSIRAERKWSPQRPRRMRESCQTFNDDGPADDQRGRQSAFSDFSISAVGACVSVLASSATILSRTSLCRLGRI